MPRRQWSVPPARARRERSDHLGEQCAESRPAGARPRRSLASRPLPTPTAPGAVATRAPAAFTIGATIRGITRTISAGVLRSLGGRQQRLHRQAKPATLVALQQLHLHQVAL